MLPKTRFWFQVGFGITHRYCYSLAIPDNAQPPPFQAVEESCSSNKVEPKSSTFPIVGRKCIRCRIFQPKWDKAGGKRVKILKINE